MLLYKILPVVFLLLPAAVFSQTTPTPDSVTVNSVRFQKVEEEASFPGGLPSWRTFLMKNLDPNIPIDNGAPSGKYTVTVQFVVGKDGAVSNIKALTNFGFGMEEEVVRIIQKSGNWSPALQNGKAVNAYRKQPVTFVLEQEDGYEIITKDPYTLFTGIDNEITVKIKKLSNSDLTVTISKGTITPTADGKYIAKLNSRGRATITVYNKKNDKQVCAASFEVKDP